MKINTSNLTAIILLSFFGGELFELVGKPHEVESGNWTGGEAFVVWISLVCFMAIGFFAGLRHSKD